MHRTRLSFHDWQYQALRTTAKDRGCSFAALVREILTAHLQDCARAGLQVIEGVAAGPPDLGPNHDAYLYGTG